MKIAVEGCCHGELDAIYAALHQLEARRQSKVDALLICGDFEAVRNYQDLECMAVPNKYKHLQTFYKYYTGEKVAPVLTLVIGGNHEASNYLSELYHGGWLAPNIYYLGCAGSILLNGIRVAGMSGIFNSRHFRLGHHERLPYDSDSMRSIYHVREFNVRRLSLLPMARIFLSHDWPQSIEHHGNLGDLLRRKSFLRGDIEKGELGSPPLMGLLRTLRPEWWFAAHLHTRFEATVVHEQEPMKPLAPLKVDNPDEISIEDDEFDAPLDTSAEEQVEQEANTNDNPAEPQHPGSTKTNFLALDKCLPKRQFLEIVDILTPSTSDSSDMPSSSPILSFDPTWLAVVRAFQPWHSTSRQQPPFPDEAEARALVAKELEWVQENIKTDSDGSIHVDSWQRFVVTAPGPATEGDKNRRQPPWFKNPQTEAFCKMLQIQNVVDPVP